MNASYGIGRELSVLTSELATAPRNAYMIAMRLVTLALSVLWSTTMIAATDPIRRTRQCLVVVSRDWNAKTGVLRAFERKSSRSAWQTHGPAIPVVLGKKGLAWGRGLVDFNAAVRKVEGDNKAPAGIFRLGPAFGYAPKPAARWIKLSYVPLTAQSEGIDDPHSRYYNQLVDRSKVARVDWHSSERMLRADDLYKWGVVVAHNSPARPGAGSCIFLHVWKDSRSATAGCTAMTEQDLLNLLRWLNPTARPVLVQMPQAGYDATRAKFRLPAVR
ncbi:MAG TPA: L,D-transpeptidase family protein [Chthoniobacterales bacterium]|nr:L,D-transpeptidase family protein [Chthoniobacterales bacterium]